MDCVQNSYKLNVLTTEKTKFCLVITYLNLKITPNFSNARFFRGFEPETY